MTLPTSGSALEEPQPATLLRGEHAGLALLKAVDSTIRIPDAADERSEGVREEITLGRRSKSALEL